MAGMIEIGSKLDAKPFIQGVDDMSEALKSVDDDIKDTAKTGDKEVGKLEKSFADAALAAREAGTQIDTGISHGVRGGVEEADVHLNSFKKSAKEAGKVAAGSMDGTMGGVLETLKVAGTELFANMGPAAAVAASAAGVAVGLIGTRIKEDEEKAKAAEERIKAMGTALIDAADAGIPLSVVADNLRKIVTNADDAPKKLKDIQDQAKKTGLSVEGLAEAYSGNTDAVDKMSESTQKAYDKELASLQKNAKDGEPVWSDKLEKLQTQSQELKSIQEETQAAADIEKEWLASGGAEIEAKNAAIESINTAYDDAAGSILDFKDKETGVLDVQAYIDSMNARAQALTDYQNSVAQSSFTTEQKSALNDMGVEAASAWMAGYQSATPEQKKAMEGFLTESAKDSSGVAKGVIDEAFKVPVKATVEVGIDAVQARHDLESLTSARKVPVVIDWRDKYGRPVG